MSGSVRIIAGQQRGRRLCCPKSDTRPTLDRVREALFSILGSIDGLVVVDFFAGSGALGLEAVSRGARQAILVESSREAARVIRQNVASLGVEQRCRVIESPVERSRPLLSTGPPIDLVLADPPWAIAPRALGLVEDAVVGLLATDATVVVGHAARDRLEPAATSRLELRTCRSWGDSALSFFEQSG